MPYLFGAMAIKNGKNFSELLDISENYQIVSTDGMEINIH